MRIFVRWREFFAERHHVYLLGCQICAQVSGRSLGMGDNFHAQNPCDSPQNISADAVKLPLFVGKGERCPVFEKTNAPAGMRFKPLAFMRAEVQGAAHPVCFAHGGYAHPVFLKGDEFRSGNLGHALFHKFQSVHIAFAHAGPECVFQQGERLGGKFFVESQAVDGTDKRQERPGNALSQAAAYSHDHVLEGCQRQKTQCGVAGAQVRFNDGALEGGDNRRRSAVHISVGARSHNDHAA